MDVFNWPWRTDEEPGAGYGDTFLQFFFSTNSHLDTTGRIRAYDEGKYMHYSAQSERALIKVDFLKVYTCDGVDRFSELNDFPFSIDFQQQVFTFPAVISICQGTGAVLPRYQTLNYDPNLNAIFTPIPEPSASPAVAKKNTLHPAAYAVPVGAAVLIIAGVAIYLFVVRPRRVESSKQRALRPSIVE
jgi:hypothetical protein